MPITLFGVVGELAGGWFFPVKWLAPTGRDDLGECTARGNA